MKKYKPILILVICSLIPLLFTATIPYILPTKLQIDSLRMNNHLWNQENKLYVIPLEGGSQYTIIVIISSTISGMDIALRIGETPYVINGFSVDSGLSTGERMHFTASKTGDYYIQIKANSGSGLFHIIVESGTTGSATGSNLEFFDVSYLLVLILPSVFIVAVGLVVLRRRASMPERQPTFSIYKRIKKEENDELAKKEDVLICEYCGIEVNKFLKKCPNCHTSLQ